MKKLSFIVATTISLMAGKNVAPVVSTPTPVPAPAPAPILSSDAIDLKLSTLGVGVDYEHMFNKKFGLRFNINGFRLTKNKVYDDIKYHAKLKLFSAGILADYHPWGGIFRISTGAYYNKNKITGTAKPNKSVTIGNTIYTPDQIGQVNAKIDFKKFAPYLGIGWSSVEHDGWHFVADIGVMFSGKPRVHIKAKAKPAFSSLQSQLDQDAKKEERNVYHDVKKYKFWPVIAIGIQKRF